MKFLKFRKIFLYYFFITFNFVTFLFACSKQIILMKLSDEVAQVNNN